MMRRPIAVSAAFMVTADAAISLRNCSCTVPPVAPTATTNAPSQVRSRWPPARRLWLRSSHCRQSARSRRLCWPIGWPASGRSPNPKEYRAPARSRWWSAADWNAPTTSTIVSGVCRRGERETRYRRQRDRAVGNIRCPISARSQRIAAATFRPLSTAADAR